MVSTELFSELGNHPAFTVLDSKLNRVEPFGYEIGMIPVSQVHIIKNIETEAPRGPIKGRNSVSSDRDAVKAQFAIDRRLFKGEIAGSDLESDNEGGTEVWLLEVNDAVADLVRNDID
ncbi:hypothetical protein [Geobacter hydrogenophilus]|uniref:hypothetical protein n=1 Tax=Geobacter hydrogenophilus TaxID=40983 RepID=UPI001FE8AD08|nr:hypothetical protein [Geobacter hydrogenophilus]